MFRLRFRLRLFLLTTVAASIFLGTVAKRLYDDWRHGQAFARQQQAAEKLKESGAGVRIRDGVATEAHIAPTAGGTRAKALLREATSLERIVAEYALDDSDI